MDPLAKAEKAIVRALGNAELGSQSQVTFSDRFEIATDDVIVRVERNPDGDYLRSLRAQRS
jgi:hypothetical protein